MADGVRSRNSAKAADFSHSEWCLSDKGMSTLQVELSKARQPFHIGGSKTFAIVPTSDEYSRIMPTTSGDVTLSASRLQSAAKGGRGVPITPIKLPLPSQAGSKRDGS